MTQSTSDFVVVGIVLLGRLLLPLLIPKYPLPGVLACLVLDSADQTIFQTFTSFALDRYQGYDKAFDIYYLVIAYLSTMRNWQNLDAFRISRFLIYWRLAGVVLFELAQWRPLLLIFPNTFEYFFIFYETVRAWWDPSRLTFRKAVEAASFIWVFIKLPQEWWVHIAQGDVTDTVKGWFGVELDASWVEAIANRPIVAVIIAAIVLAALAAVRFILIPRLPSADHPLQLAGESMPVEADTPEERRALFAHDQHPFDAAMLEKIILVSLVSVIFAQILPNFRSSDLQVVVGVSLIVGVNSVASYWMARQGYGWQGTVAQFLVMAAVNAVIAVVAYLLIPRSAPINLPNTLFLLLLLTLLVTIYDVYRPVYAARAAQLIEGETT